MRLVGTIPAILVCGLLGTHAQQRGTSAEAPAEPPGTRLEDVAWPAAGDRLKPEAVVVLPLGPAAQQHGPHMTLGAERRLVEHLTRRLLETADVVAAPPLTYAYQPAFTEYPGSTSLSADIAAGAVRDVARSLAAHGPRRFYVLNTTLAHEALAESARALASDGILLRYTDAPTRLEAAMRRIRRQAIGGHADEIRTSMMLYVAPSAVDMRRAVREYGNASSPFRLTRRGGGSATHSVSGVWGDATLATPEKGRVLVDALVAAIRTDVEQLRAAAVPGAASPRPHAPRPSGSGARQAGPGSLPPGVCLPGEDRAIRAIAPAFYIAWRNHDAGIIGEFWRPEGDMIHPDGFIEGSAQVIRQNRATLFGRPEYRDSRHSLTFGQVRCIAEDVAIADAKWELTGVTDARGAALPPSEGLCTLVLKKAQGRWRIEAYRYTVNAQASNRPSVLPKPGFIDRIK
jgi:creatinine amidohydrolase